MATITLTIPDTLVPRIVAMMRARYATQIPAGTPDAAVARGVLKFWLKKALADYEADQATATGQTNVTAAIAARDAATATARTDAETAADAIT